MANKLFLSSLIGFLFFLTLNNATAQTRKNGIIAYADTSTFSSLDEVLQLPELKNKVVYIDVWGTKCTPCIEEFPYLENIRQKYKDKDVAFLFLKAPYGYEDRKAWKKMMKKYKLKGVNIAMSIRFYTSNFWNRYEKFFPADKLFAIPIYLLAGKNGSIVNYDSPRPEETVRLYPIIDSLLH